MNFVQSNYSRQQNCHIDFLERAHPAAATIFTLYIGFELYIFLKSSSTQLFLAFLRLRRVITSFCLSPSTSANLRLISEYLSCISFSSLSMHWFFSLRESSSISISLMLHSSLFVVDGFTSLSIEISSSLRRRKYHK